MRSNSADFIRSAVTQGLGLALRATCDIGPELERGELQVVLPDYSGSSKSAIFAVYPCREFMPSKVSAFIDLFGEISRRTPAWIKANATPAGPLRALSAIKTLKKAVSKTA
jgi:DNA-binding transcriptional LysR family regulator